MNFNTYISIRIHWLDLYLNGDFVAYFGSFGVFHNPKEIKKFIGNKNIPTNIYRIQAYDSVIWEYFCIVIIDFIVKGKSFWDCSNSFSPNKCEKNDKIILKYYQQLKTKNLLDE